LEGLQGIKKVTIGFLKSREVNTVIYDPNRITPEQMITALKRASTYQGIAEQ
jgi:hypothetical protein